MSWHSKEIQKFHSFSSQIFTGFYNHSVLRWALKVTKAEQAHCPALFFVQLWDLDIGIHHFVYVSTVTALIKPDVLQGFASASSKFLTGAGQIAPRG